MLEAITKYGVVFYVMGAAVAIGLAAKMLAYFTVRKMVRAASEIQKSNHRFMRLVKAKFEHASMVSDKVQNVEAFVNKYLYEYRVLGMSVNFLRELPKKMVWTTLAAGIVGTCVQYVVHGSEEAMFQMGGITCALAVLLWGINSLSNEQAKLEATRNYMVDYFENVCMHRYEKMSREDSDLETEQPIKEQPPQADETGEKDCVEPAQGAADQARQDQEARIRAILQEFLAE